MLFPCFEAWFSDAGIAIVDSEPPKCEPNLHFNCFPCNVYHLPLPSRETCLTNGFVAAARLFPCRSSLDARPRCDCFYSGFKRNVLTSGVEEMCLKNGSVEPARPCCFPVLRPGFRTPGLLLSTANHRNVSQTFVLIAFRAKFTTYHCGRGKRGSKMRLTNGSVAAARLCCSPAGAVWMLGRGVFL